MQSQCERHSQIISSHRLDELSRQCEGLLCTLSQTAASRNLYDIFSEMLERLHQYLRFDYLSFGLFNPLRNCVSALLQAGEYEFPSECPVLENSLGVVIHRRVPIEVPDINNDGLFPDMTEFCKPSPYRSFRVVPLATDRQTLGTLAVARKRTGTFSPEDVSYLDHISQLVSLVLENTLMADVLGREKKRFEIENARARDEIAALKDKLSKEKLYLEDELSSIHNFGEVVGDSPALRHVLKQVEIAAPSDATVLLLGETGTGKELIARAVHRLSARRDGNFIKLNCAAIPTGLLESELFGHEKGAFTGAISQKVGRLELADKGTLFLDEIGEIPTELQPKLLRVLQDQEFERLGGIRTIKVNVRVVAATNRDLAQAVAEHQFRSDLFYRLNVFPIRLPALRDRPGDIPLLVQYFVQKFARRMGKRIESIPVDLIREFQQWNWPGNIRELENFIERSVILTQGPVFYAPMAELRAYSPDRSRPPATTLEDVEREYIVRSLRESGGIISGPRGAAARLGMKRTTLQSRIQKLGIRRQEYRI